MTTTVRSRTLGICLAGFAAALAGCAPEGDIDDAVDQSAGIEIHHSPDLTGGDEGDLAEASEALSSTGFSTYAGAAGWEDAAKPAVDAAGNVYVAGTMTVAGQATDIFLRKYSPQGALLFSMSLGGTGSEDFRDIAVDSAGNSYIGAKSSSAGSKTIFIAKLNSAGTLVYYGWFGGSGTDEPRAIAVDSAGNTYLTGWTSSPDFPLIGAIQPNLRGPWDAFVTRVNASGTQLTYSTYLGGDNVDFGFDIAVDSAGYMYIVGETQPPNNGNLFPTTNGAFKTSPAGNHDGFVTELQPNGLPYYSTYLGGSGYDIASGVVVDAAYQAYVTGYTNSPNFFTTPGAFRTSRNGDYDTFALKLNEPGNGVYYSTFVGSGGSGQTVPSIALGSGGKATVAGMTMSNIFPVTANAFQKTFSGVGDGYLIELNASGTGSTYSTYMGGTGYDAALGVTVDSSGNAYVAGTTSSGDFPVFAAAQPFYGGSQDGFLVKIKGP